MHVRAEINTTFYPDNVDDISFRQFVLKTKKIFSFNKKIFFLVNLLFSNIMQNLICNTNLKNKQNHISSQIVQKLILLSKKYFK